MMEKLNLLRKRLVEENLSMFEMLEVKDEILELERELGISSEPPPGSNYQCEGCGS
jgi:hypothetical protein